MADEVVARARALVGTRFRLHGRDAHGVDCIGLAAHAWSLDAPTGYALRGDARERLEREVEALGFRRTANLQTGLLVLDAGPAQLHLGVWTGATLIHADAGLRRVVETPGRPRWPVLSMWTR